MPKRKAPKTTSRVKRGISVSIAPKTAQPSGAATAAAHMAAFPKLISRRQSPPSIVSATARTLQIDTLWAVYPAKPASSHAKQQQKQFHWLLTLAKDQGYPLRHCCGHCRSG